MFSTKQISAHELLILVRHLVKILIWLKPLWVYHTQMKVAFLVFIRYILWLRFYVPFQEYIEYIASSWLHV